MSLTISAAQVDALIANPSSISGYSASGPIIISGAITFGQANSLNAVDATYIQATISSATVQELAGIAVNNSSRAALNKFTIVVSDTSATAAELNAVQALTSIAVDASNLTATNSTGIEASPSLDITTLYTGTVPTGIGTAAIKVNDTTANAATLKAIDSYTTGTVTTTATKIEGTAADLHAVVDGGIAHAADVPMTVSDTTFAATDLNAVDALTTGLITVSANMMTGNITDISTAYSAASTAITGLAAINLTVEADSSGVNPTVAHVVTAIGKTTGTVTATIRTSLNALTDFASVTGTGHVLTIEPLDDATVAAAALKALDGKITTPISFANAGGVSGAVPAITATSYEDLIAIFNSSSISGISTSPVTLTVDTISVAEANILNAKTSGVITATINENAASTLKGLNVSRGTTANAYSLTVGDSEPTAADLNTIAGLTSVAVGIGGVSKITGTLDETHTLYANKANFTGIGNELVTVTSTVLDAAKVTELNADTTGMITFSNTVTAFSGDAAQVKALLALSAANAGAGDEVSGINPTATITVSGDKTDGDIQATDLAAIETITSANNTVLQIDPSVVSLNGTDTAVRALLVKSTVSSDGTIGVASPTISGLAGKAIILDNGLNNNTTQAVTLAEYLGIQDNYNTGKITATLSGTDIDTLTEAIAFKSGTSGPRKINSGNALSFASLKDTTVDAADIVTLSGMTSGLITFSDAGGGGNTAALTSITGSLSELKAIYDKKSTTAPGINGIEDAPLTVEKGNLSAADLAFIDDNTTGTSGEITVPATGTTITGLAADLISVLDAADDAAGGDNHTINFGNTNNEATVDIVVTDVTLSDTHALELLAGSTANQALTTGQITLLSSNLEGDYTDLVNITGTKGPGLGAKLTGLAAMNLIVTGTPTETEVATLAADTTGVVTATITGRTVAQLLDGTNGLKEPISSTFTGHNLTIKVNAAADSTVQAEAINDIATYTKGKVILDTDTTTVGNQSPTITGTVTALNTLYADSKIEGKSGSALTIVSGATAAQLAALDGKTTGVITATVTDGDMATLSTLDANNAVSASVSDASIVATELTALDAKVSGQLEVSASNTITGTLAEVTAVMNAATITGRDVAKYSINGNITVAEAAAIQGKTSGAISATITETDLDSLLGKGILAVKADSTGGADTLGETHAHSVAGTYSIGVGDYTSSAAASTNATFSVTIASDGTPTVAITNPGHSYTADDIITISRAKLGGSASTGTASSTISFMVKTAGPTITSETTNNWTTTVANQSPENASVAGVQLVEKISAADLNTLNSKTNSVVTVTAPSIEGTLADLNTAFDNNTPIVAGKVDLSGRTISGLEDKAVTITDGSITLTEAEAFQANKTGIITATIGKNDYTNDTAGTVTQGAVNIVARVKSTETHQTDRAAAGTFVFTDDSSLGATAKMTSNSTNGSGAKFTLTVADGGIATLGTTSGHTAAVNANGTDRATGGGTFYINTDQTGVTVGAGKVGAQLKIVILSSGAMDTTNSAVLVKGTGFAANDSISIASELLGGASGNTALVLKAASVVDDGYSLAITDAGSGYKSDTVFTLPTTVTNASGVALGGGADITVAIDGATGLGAVRPNSTGQAGITNNKYDIAANGYTTSGKGTGATFAIAVGDDGFATVTGLTGGTGFEVGDTITVPKAGLGGGTGTPNLTFAVGSVGKDSMSDVISKTDGAFDLKQNNYSISIEDAAVTATDVLTAKSLTTGLVTLTASTTDITGSLADIKSIYAQEKTSTGTTGITGIANSTLDIRGDVGLISAADLKALDAETSGLITITPAESSITGISGTLADLKAVLKQDKLLAAAGASGTTSPTITGLLKAPGAITAATNNPTNFDSNTRTEGTYLIAATGGSGIGAVFEVKVAANGTGTVTLKQKGSGYTAGNTLTIPKTGGYGGTANDITVDVNSIETAAPMTVTVTDSVTALELKGLIDDYTAIPTNGGAVTGQGSIGEITATVSDTTMAKLAVIPSAVNTSGDAGGANVTGIEGKYSITISDAEIDATALNTLDAKTKTAISISSSTPTITGALTTGATDAVNKALASKGITGASALNVKADAGTYTIAQANYASALTTGVITATIASSTLTALGALNETGNAYTIDVSDTGTVDASALNVLNNKTTGVVSINATKVTGALSDIKSLYDANTAGEISGLGNEVVTISDTGSVSAATLNSVNSLTTGVVTAVGVTSVTGTLADIKAAYGAGSAGTISGLGNEAISISDLGTVVTSSDLADIKALTSGTVTVSLSGTSVTASSLNSLDSSSTETVNAAGVTTITGAAAEISTVYSAAGITGLGDEKVTLTDTSIDASTLNTIDGKTTGSVTAGTVTTITGSIADVDTAYSSGIIGLGNEAVTLSGTTASASVLNSLDGKTTGKIDASTLTKLTGTSADVKTAFDSAGISGLTFDASNYLASYTDLLAAYGSDLVSARAHYFAFGAEEGRAFDAFDETSYLASYSDLLGAFGTNVDSALVHYINNGYSEGRVADSFDENSYLASNTSLIGTVTDAAAHYVNTGYAAGLALDSFDENSYLASNTSLIGTVTDATAHYVSTGYAAGLAADSFDELGYIASHSDLIAAYGVDGAAGTQHFITYGSTEGRTTTFDAASYLAAHADLRAAYGTDQELAKQHYITFGSTEGRALT